MTSGFIAPGSSVAHAAAVISRASGPYNRLHPDRGRVAAEGLMSDPRQGVPEGASAVIPRLFCRDPGAEVEFCVAAFDAEERVRRPGPDGTVAHALIMIGPAMVMIESEWPEAPNRAPAPDGSTPVALYVYVENVDQTVQRAVARGARVLMPAANQPWGDRIAW